MSLYIAKGKKMKKILTTFLISVLTILGVSYPVHAQSDSSTFEVGEIQREDQPITNVDENGNVTFIDADAMEEEISSIPMVMANDTSSRSIDVGVVNFRTKSSANENTLYVEDSTNKQGYLNGYAASDGAFLGYNSDYSKVKFKIAGVIGWVDSNQVSIVDYNSVSSVSYYVVNSGVLYHVTTNNIYQSNYASKVMIGYNPGYLQENVPYYSYDGHYFYTSYQSMINDYRAGSYTSSVNSNDPYFNYFQYLPHRSKTAHTTSDFDNLTNSKANGKLNGLGSYFIEYQNQYGTNAALMYGVAVLESGWGTSNIAKTKNNLFGHGAVDSNPYYGANGYDTPADSILYHSKFFISEGYCDPLDYNGRYFGSHLGDKASGINVKYASDPYWGEKAASIVWQLNGASQNDDYSRYTIGIKTKGINIEVHRDPTLSSTTLYQSGSADYYPMILLAETQGDNVSGNNIWYKIQSDPTLDASRSQIVQDQGEYDFNNFYGYINSHNMFKIIQGSNSWFHDVYTTDWFYESIKYVYDNELMTGLNETTFGPYENLARAQFAVILHRMNGSPDIEYTNKFPDVADNQWYTDAILWASDIGVVTGYEDTGKFGPGDNINREQMAVMMYRYANYLGYDTSARANISKYTDAGNVNEFAKEAMSWAVGEGIITGKYNETQLDPQGNASRAECATIIMRFIESYK